MAGTCEKPGIIRVTLRCSTCKFEWTEDTPDRPRVARKADRRAVPRPTAAAAGDTNWRRKVT
jgi:hypothetical protein